VTLSQKKCGKRSQVARAYQHVQAPGFNPQQCKKTKIETYFKEGKSVSRERQQEL
jgi:hypothetical protein